MITYMPPLLTYKESFQARSDILSLRRRLNFHQYKYSGKEHVSSNTDQGYNEVFSSEIIRELSTRVSSSSTLGYITQLAYATTDTFALPGLRIAPFIPALGHGRSIHKQTWCDQYSSESDEKSYVESCLACRRIPVKLTMQFSILEANAYISPHTDSVCKLASIMVYLAKDHSQVSSQLGTRFWVDNDWHLGTHNQGMSQKTSEFISDGPEVNYFSNTRHLDTHFGIGTTVIFFRTNTSWHSVNMPSDLCDSRVSININLVVPSKHAPLYSEVLRGFQG